MRIQFQETYLRIHTKLYSSWEVLRHNIIGLDVEGNEDELRTVQFASQEEAWVLEVTSNKELIREILIKASRFVTHTDYDSRMILHHLGIDIFDKVYDTYVLSCLTWPGETQRHGLKEVSAKIIDTGLKEAEQELYLAFRDFASVRKQAEYRSIGFKNFPLDDPRWVKYAGLDAIYVRRVYDVLSSPLDHLMEREHRLVALTSRAAARGIKVDRERTETLLKETEAEINAASEKIIAITGAPSALSPAVAVWLEEKGLVFTDRTPKGHPSLDKNSLPKLLQKTSNPILKEVLLARSAISAQTNRRANLTNFLSYSERDGRVHPFIRTCRARTGRMSITNPGMQTLKKGDDGDVSLRACFVADPGYVFISADYDQIELRIAAALSGDPVLTEAILSEEDLHDTTARLIFGPNFSEDERAIAKTTNFLTLYGGGADKLAQSTKIDLAQASDIVKKKKAAYPFLSWYIKDLGRRSSVTVYSGRVIPADEGRQFANFNYEDQGTGREILVDALFRVEEGMPNTLVLPVHDEILLQVKENEAEESLEKLKFAMSCEFRGIPITASGKVLGKRWFAGK